MIDNSDDGYVINNENSGNGPDAGFHDRVNPNLNYAHQLYNGSNYGQAGKDICKEWSSEQEGLIE